MNWQYIKETSSNIYSYLEDILIIKEYEINQDNDLITQTETFILRYRRILGIILLCILLYILYKCKNKVHNTIQKGAGDNNNLGLTNLFKENENKPPEKTATGKGGKSKTFVGKITTKFKDKLTERGRKSISSAKKFIGETNTAQKYKSMRDVGLSRLQIGKRAMYGIGSAAGVVGNKFKEFAGWLYEILFAIAISIAICMVIVPSLSFFIVGIICYFLLKNKVSSLKSA
jgi:hypothetical protein